MTYTAKDYARLIGMAGFSEALLKNHFTLYQGYVTNTNKVLDILEQMLKEGKAATPEFAELKRRLGWEFNGMRLHEYYFENLGGNGAPGCGRQTGEEDGRELRQRRGLGKGFPGNGGDARHRLGSPLPGPRQRQAHQFLDQ